MAEAKAPPNSVEAEMAVIGSLLMDNARCNLIISEYGITEDHFYTPSNRMVFSAINHLLRSSRPADITTVCQELKDDGKLDLVGGINGVSSIIDATPTSAHAEYYAKILDDKYIARTAQRIIQGGGINLSEAKEPRVLVSDIALDLMRMSDKASKSKKVEVLNAEQKTSWVNASKGVPVGIPTPWDNINSRFQGLQPSAVTLLAGRGGRGKSAIMATWGHFLGGMGYKVGWLPLEDGCKRTWGRVAGIDGGFSTFRLDTGNGDAELLDLAFKSLDRVQSWPIFMEDTPMTVEQICAWATMQKTKNAIDVLFIDAFKDILREDHDVLGDNKCSQLIAALAKRLDIPILINHHVRKAGADPRAQPTKLTEQDIRGSGRLSDDSRQILILQNYVEDGYDKYELDIIKNNYGPTGSYPLIRLSNISKFVQPTNAPKKVRTPYGDDENS